MKNKWDTFLNCLIGSFVGVFAVRGILTFRDYRLHPERYAVMSAPWYTVILLFGILTALIVAAALAVKFVLWKKKAYLLLAILILAAVIPAVWVAGYQGRKSNDNLPSLAAIGQMEEAEANGIVCGYRRIQLEDVWGQADRTEEAEDVWQLEDGRLFRVNYNDDGRAVVCSMGPELIPKETFRVTVTYSDGAAETSRQLTEEEVAALKDWASGLDMEQRTFAEGEAPNEVYAGGEAWRFEVNGGAEGFAYVVINGAYVVTNGQWYLVGNPSPPPLEAEGGADV